MASVQQSPLGEAVLGKIVFSSSTGVLAVSMGTTGVSTWWRRCEKSHMSKRKGGQTPSPVYINSPFSEVVLGERYHATTPAEKC